VPNARIVPAASGRRVRIRQAAVVVCAAVVVGGGYVALRTSSVFAVDRVVVVGGSAALDQVVEARTRALVGSGSLLAVDPAALARAIVALPVVRAVHVDRAFPNTLRIVVTPELAAAVVDTSRGRVVVAESGRVVAFALSRGALPQLMAPGASVPTPGGAVSSKLSDELTVAIAARRRGLPAIAVVGQTPDGLVARTWAGDTAVVLGDSSDLERKLRIAAAMLRTRGIDATGSPAPVQYVDVSVPRYPVMRTGVGDTATMQGSDQALAIPAASIPPDVATISSDLFQPPNVLSTGE
jgi:cell division protein FtsQ